MFDLIQHSAFFYRVKAFLTILIAYTAIVGIFTFPLFIHEEALQTIMFGTWAADSAGRHDMALKGVDAMRSINTSMRWINYLFGWVNPLSFAAYRNYAMASDIYSDAAEAKALKKDPGLISGRVIEREFSIRRKELTSEGKWHFSDGTVVIVADHDMPIGRSFIIKGRATVLDNMLQIEDWKIR